MAAFTSLSFRSNCDTTAFVSISRGIVRGCEVGATVGKCAGFRQTGSWGRSCVDDGRMVFRKLYESCRCRASWRKSLELCETKGDCQRAMSSWGVGAELNRYEVGAPR